MSIPIQNVFALVICGSRYFNDYATASTAIDKVLSKQVASGKHILIISGGARGADTLAARYAKEHHYDFTEFPADWNKYGKSAGPRRNKEMQAYAATFPNRGCLAFLYQNSRGTAHSIKCAEQHNTPLRIYNIIQTELA